MYVMSNQIPPSATQRPKVVNMSPQQNQSTSWFIWFKDIFRKQFNNLQDWLSFIGILLTIFALIWGVFAWSIDSRFDAMDKKLDAVNLQNQANYEKISAEIKGGNLDVQKSIQDLDYQQKILGLELKKKK